MPVAIDFNDNVRTCRDRCAITCEYGSSYAKILLVPEHLHARVLAVLLNKIP